MDPVSHQGCPSEGDASSPSLSVSGRERAASPGDRLYVLQKPLGMSQRAIWLPYMGPQGDHSAGLRQVLRAPAKREIRPAGEQGLHHGGEAFLA